VRRHDRDQAIPPARCFMMADSRGASDDSRFSGPVRVDATGVRVDAFGRAFARHCRPGSRFV
jgi:hypothetical protein